MAGASDFVRQAAAIPIKGDQVCLVTSSNGKRWVIPKGVIDPGHTPGETALQEAWEEAGLVGILHKQPVGSYLYDKWGKTCHVTVFVMQVTEVAQRWPEQELRQRVWLSVSEALGRLEDEGLRQLIHAALPGGEVGSS